MSKPKSYYTAFLSRWDKKGLTFLELVVVILIIGILASIAIMVLLDYRNRAYVATLKSDLSSAYQVGVQYHTENPSGSLTVDSLRSYGFRGSKDVDLNIVDGVAETLLITATHPGARGVYQVDEEGRISQQ